MNIELSKAPRREAKLLFEDGRDAMPFDDGLLSALNLGDCLILNDAKPYGLVHEGLRDTNGDEVTIEIKDRIGENDMQEPIHICEIPNHLPYRDVIHLCDNAMTIQLVGVLDSDFLTDMYLQSKGVKENTYHRTCRITNGYDLIYKGHARLPEYLDKETPNEYAVNKMGVCLPDGANVTKATILKLLLKGVNIAYVTASGMSYGKIEAPIEYNLTQDNADIINKSKKIYAMGHEVLRAVMDSRLHSGFIAKSGISKMDNYQHWEGGLIHYSDGIYGDSILKESPF